MRSLICLTQLPDDLCRLFSALTRPLHALAGTTGPILPSLPQPEYLCRPRRGTAFRAVIHRSRPLLPEAEDARHDHRGFRIVPRRHYSSYHAQQLVQHHQLRQFGPCKCGAGDRYALVCLFTHAHATSAAQDVSEPVPCSQKVLARSELRSSHFRVRPVIFCIF